MKKQTTRRTPKPKFQLVMNELELTYAALCICRYFNSTNETAVEAVKIMLRVSGRMEPEHHTLDDMPLGSLKIS
jgi:hypothetical protein